MPNSEVRVVYGYCQNNCKYPVYTKEDVVGLLEYVIENNALPPDLIIDGEINSAAQIASVNAITEQNKGNALKIWVGTQAEYDAYEEDKTNIFAIITDDKTKEEIVNTINHHTEVLKDIEQRLTNLGFREGSITLASGITAPTNRIMRQGNFCIMELSLDLNFDDSNVVNMVNQMMWNEEPIIVGEISSDFFPEYAEGTNSISTITYFFRTNYSTTYVSTALELIIQKETDGRHLVKLKRVGAYQSQQSYTDRNAVQKVTSFGYKALPLI